jgi:hypothetical protein
MMILPFVPNFFILDIPDSPHISYKHSLPTDVEKGVKDLEDNDDIVYSAANSDLLTSPKERLQSSSTVPSRNRKSTSMQSPAAVFSDATKERSLSVTNQMLGKLQDGEIKRFLTGLGNLAKSCELQGIENSAIPKRASFKSPGTLNCHSSENAVSSQYSHNTSTEHGRVDTVLITDKSQNLLNKSFAV